jgi:alpha-L-fucosidase
LITGYGPLGILWFDGEWEKPWTHDRGVDLYNYLRELQPSLIINNRVGKGRAGMEGMNKGNAVGDYGTPEQQIPATGFGSGVDWESCMTMNNTWGYRKDDHNWKSTQTLIRNLIDCSSKGGNYLLNVGPTAEGLIPQPEVDLLAAMGKWLKVNGEAVYGAAANPFPREQPATPAAAPDAAAGRGRGARPPVVWDWRATRKLKADGSGKIYIHIFQWPADGKFTITSPYKAQVVKAYLLANPKTKIDAKTTADADRTTFALKLPAQAPDPIATVVCLEVKP